jgi:hypothetical protein
MELPTHIQSPCLVEVEAGRGVHRKLQVVEAAVVVQEDLWRYLGEAVVEEELEDRRSC